MAENAIAELIKNLPPEKQKELLGFFTDLTGKIKEVSQAVDVGLDNLSDTTGPDGFAETMAGLAGVTSDFNNTFLGTISNLAEAASGTGDAANSMDKYVDSLKKAFNPLDIIASGVSRLAQTMSALAYGTDSAMATFNRATGATRMYGEQIVGLQMEMQGLQIGIEDIGASYTALVDNFGNFNNLSSTQQQELARNTALLSELGVSANTTAASLNMLTTGFGMSAEKAAASQRELFALARDIGMAPSTMSDGFQQALPTLSRFGSKSLEVYKKIAVNAKAAGMEVGQLLKITEQFDTFEGAAESVGKLNAILGGPYLSATRMIQTTDPTERMKMLSDATREAGQSFDELGYYERKALASAMGLSDVSELALVMSGNFDKTSKSVQKTSADYAALAMQTEEFNTVTDAMNNLLKSLVINLGPLIMAVKSFVGGLTQAISIYPALKAAIGGLVVAMGALVVAIAAVSLATDVALFGIPTLIKAIVAGIALIVSGITIMMSYVGSLHSIAEGFMAGNYAATALRLAILGLVSAIVFALAPALFPIIASLYVLYSLWTKWTDIVDTFFKIGNKYFKPIMKVLNEQMAMLKKETKLLTKEFNDLKEQVMDNAGVILKEYLPLLKLVGGIIGAVLYAAVTELAFRLRYLAKATRIVIAAFSIMNNFITQVLSKTIWALQTPVRLLQELLSFMYNFLQIGNSPSFLDVLGYLVDAFKALGDIMTFPARQLMNLKSIFVDVWSYIMNNKDELLGMLSGGLEVAANVLGINNSSPTQEIASAQAEHTKALIESNKEVVASVKKLNETIEKRINTPQEVDVNINANLGKMFSVTEEKINRKMLGKPVFGT